VLVAGMTLFFCKGGAQGVFAFRARLKDTVSADGFYQILLTPEVVAKCRVDLADVRILGPDNRFVSYVLKNSRAGKKEEEEWLSISGAVFTQKDSSNKHTYVYLRFPEAYEIDWVAFMIRDPTFYKREAKVSAAGANPGQAEILAHRAEGHSRDRPHEQAGLPRLPQGGRAAAGVERHGYRGRQHQQGCDERPQGARTKRRRRTAVRRKLR